MDVLLLLVDTGLMLFLCYWAIANDAAGNGTPGGFFAYRSDQTPPPDQTPSNRVSRNARRLHHRRHLNRS